MQGFERKQEKQEQTSSKSSSTDLSGSRLKPECADTASTKLVPAASSVRRSACKKSNERGRANRMKQSRGSHTVAEPARSWRCSTEVPRCYSVDFDIAQIHHNEGWPVFRGQEPAPLQAHELRAQNQLSPKVADTCACTLPMGTGVIKGTQRDNQRTETHHRQHELRRGS